MVVPIKLATTPLRIEVGTPVSSPPILSIFASSKESPSVPKGLYRPGLHRAPARRPSKPAPGTSTPCRSEGSLAPVVGHGRGARPLSGCVFCVEAVGHEHVSWAVCDHQGRSGAHG